MTLEPTDTLDADLTAQPTSPAVWADWITIWHSEWAAMAWDREIQEAGQRAAALWAAQAHAMSGS